MSEIKDDSYPEIFFDTETTGKSHKYCGIVEIGLIKRVDKKIVDTLQIYFKYNPDDKWEEGAFKVHGLSREFLKDKSLFAEEADKIIEFIKGGDMIAHNAPFDIDFLNKELERAKKGSVYDYIHKVYDTLKISKAARAGKKGHSLDVLAEEFGVDKTNREEFHGALVDTQILIPVYDRLLEMTAGKVNDFHEIKERSPIQYIDIKNFQIPSIIVSEEDRLANNAILDDIEEQEKVIPVARKGLSDPAKHEEVKQETAKKFKMI